MSDKLLVSIGSMAHRTMDFQPQSLTRRQLLRLVGFSGAAAALSTLLPRALAAERSAPSLKGSEPGYYRFNLGSIEAVAVSDGGIASPLSQMKWWADIPDAEVSATLQSAFESPNEIRLGITVLLLRIGGQLVMIDSGCGSLFGPIGGHLIPNLATIGVHPEDISTIILSHLHGDHFGGLMNSEQKPSFPNAKVFINEVEHAFWSQSSPDLSAVRMPEDGKKMALQNAKLCLAALKDRWQLIKAGDELFPGVKTVNAPGHTPGHMGVEISSGSERLLHIADAAHHHTVSFEHPEWKFVADTQPELAEKTRRELFQRAVADRLRLFGAHLPFPALGHVRKADGHYEYVIEPWVS